MRIRVYLIISLSVIAFFYNYNLSFAGGKASSMGGLVAVVSDGPFDASRNPALLSLQKNKNAVGIFFSYKPHFARYSSAQADTSIYGSGVSNYNIDLDVYAKNGKPDIYGINGHLAYSTKIMGSFIGFAITNIEADQYSIYKRIDKTTFLMTVTELSTSYTSNEENYERTIEKNKNINPCFVTAAGFNITNKSSVGLQFILGYSKKEEESIITARNVSNSYEYYEETTTREDTNAISIEAGLGYLYKENDTQVGLLIRSGEITRKKKELEVGYKAYHIQTPPSFTFLPSRSSAFSSIGRYTKGATLAAGGYRRINNFFAIAFEGEFRFENVYNDRDIELIEPDNGDYFYYSYPYPSSPITCSQRSKNSIFIKGGAEFTPVSMLAFTLGAGYTFYHSERYRNEGDSHDSYAYDNELSIENQVDYYIFTFGIDYYLSSNIDLIIAATLIDYDNRMYMQIRRQYIAIQLQDHSKGDNIDLGLGLTFTF